MLPAGVPGNRIKTLHKQGNSPPQHCCLRAAVLQKSLKREREREREHNDGSAKNQPLIWSHVCIGYVRTLIGTVSPFANDGYIYWLESLANYCLVGNNNSRARESKKIGSLATNWYSFSILICSWRNHDRNMRRQYCLQKLSVGGADARYYAINSE